MPVEKRIGTGIATGVVAVLWWFARGTVESWFFDQVLKVIEPLPIWSSLVEYGPPALLAAISIWLIWSGSRRVNMLSSKELRGKIVTAEKKPEFITVVEAARRLYEVARTEGSLLATAAERMSGAKNGGITAGSHRMTSLTSQLTISQDISPSTERGLRRRCSNE
jgi:hypothetical protein